MKKQPLLGALSLIFLVPAHVCAITTYDIELIGLYDDPVYNSGGNFVSVLADNGYVGGTTNRYLNMDLGQAVWLYSGVDTSRLGFFDSAFTRRDGYQYSAIYGITADGQVIGESLEYLRRGTINRAWISDSAGIQQIGLTDEMLAGAVGSNFDNHVIGFNDSAQVTGYASSNQTSASWLYRNGETTRIGLYGDTHTNPLTGVQDSRPDLINQAGQVVGTSTRYYQNPEGNFVEAAGRSAWLYNGVESVELGLRGMGYVLDGVTQDSRPILLNNAGQVAGYSLRFSDGADLGRAAWLYNGVELLRIGLYDSRFTDPVNGEQFTELVDMNEAGQVTGESMRYYSGQYSVSTAWISDGSTVTELSLRGSMFDINGDTGDSSVVDMNEAGVVVGRNASFSAGTDVSGYQLPAGYSAWIYHDGVIQRIGLLDDDHLGDFANHNSSIVALNEQGQVIGTSRSFGEPSTVFGNARSAWLFDGDQTRAIGLAAEDPLSSTELYSNRPVFLNEQGQVAGESLYYRGDPAGYGESAWFYDPNIDTTFEMLFSERSDGYSYSNVGFLSENGTLLGEYRLFDENDSYTDRIYMFTTDDGFYDLGELFVDEQDAFDWSHLYALIAANDTGFIAGQGVHSIYGPAAFVMSPVVVPVPAALWLFASGLLGLVALGRRASV